MGCSRQEWVKHYATYHYASRTMLRKHLSGFADYTSTENCFHCAQCRQSFLSLSNDLNLAPGNWSVTSRRVADGWYGHQLGLGASIVQRRSKPTAILPSAGRLSAIFAGCKPPCQFAPRLTDPRISIEKFRNFGISNDSKISEFLNPSLDSVKALSLLCASRDECNIGT